MADTRRGVLTCRGVDRGFLALVPPSPTSLVLVLHGSDSDADRLRELSGHTFDHLTDRSALVVYAEAHGGVWNDARLGTVSLAREQGLDDVAFLRELVACLREEYAVPPGRVFAAGFSNGGQMVMRLVMQTPDLLTGAAVIASNFPAPGNILPEMESLDQRQPVPVLTINGSADPIVPFEGGESSLWGQQSRGQVLSSMASASYFAERNGISTAPVTEQVTTGRLATSITRWREPGRAPVDCYAIEGGGHTLPNRTHRAPLVLGPTQRDLDTGELVADFFDL